jgi:hypothetical protein
VDSRAGRTCFTILLPLPDDAADNNEGAP